MKDKRINPPHRPYCQSNLSRVILAMTSGSFDDECHHACWVDVFLEDEKEGKVTLADHVRKLRVEVMGFAISRSSLFQADTVWGDSKVAPFSSRNIAFDWWKIHISRGSHRCIEFGTSVVSSGQVDRACLATRLWPDVDSNDELQSSMTIAWRLNRPGLKGIILTTLEIRPIYGDFFFYYYYFSPSLSWTDIKESNDDSKRRKNHKISQYCKSTYCGSSLICQRLTRDLEQNSGLIRWLPGSLFLEGSMLHSTLS